MSAEGSGHGGGKKVEQVVILSAEKSLLMSVKFVEGFLK